MNKLINFINEKYGIPIKSIKKFNDCLYGCIYEIEFINGKTITLKGGF